MRHLNRRALWLALLLTLSLCSTAHAQSAPKYRVLVFTKAAGFVHDSIAPAARAIQELGAANAFAVDTTDDPAAFTDANLARYATVVFVSTTGNVLPEPSQRAALERYIRNGGGYAGFHAAADMGDTATTWPWYAGLVGATFKAHPLVAWTDHPEYLPPGLFTIAGPYAQAPADAGDISSYFGFPITAKSSLLGRVWIEDPASPMMRPWASSQSITRTDEWYGFLTNPRSNVHVTASMDESSYLVGASSMGSDHPIAWCQRYDGGRSVYDAMGHDASAWSDPALRASALGAIQMAAGDAPFNCPTRTAQAGVGGSVPATLSLTLGTPGSLGSFSPGVARDYTAQTAASVTTTAGDATLSVADLSSSAPGHLVNGSFSLPSALTVSAGGAPAAVGTATAPAILKSWTGPASNDMLTLVFAQHIGATDAIRTGTYSKTLTFTLSTTNP